MHDVPQLFAGDGASHVAPQVSVPAGHVQAPFWQVVPPVQAKATPHPPQLFGSVCSSTHTPSPEQITLSGADTPPTFPQAWDDVIAY
jgi:hypothetical protein